MKKENLLSIGALSKQTGVHIKSLRYYDSLGILRPACVDPGSGYRYYSLQQIPVVDAIQLCIDLDIPPQAVYGLLHGRRQPDSLRQID